MACCYGSEVITIDDEVIDVDTCDSSQTSESTTMTLSLDWNSAPSAAATRSLLHSVQPYESHDFAVHYDLSVKALLSHRAIFHYS